MAASGISDIAPGTFRCTLVASDDRGMFEVLRAAERTATPWRNGNGITWPVAVWPTGATADDFECRLSIAEIASDATFSSYPGIDRLIGVIDGPGLELSIDGEPCFLARNEIHRFAGEAAVSCTLTAGRTYDLNLMTRRPHARGSMEFVRVDATNVQLDADCLVLVGGSAVVNGVELERFDAILSDSPVQVSGADAILAVISIDVTAVRTRDAMEEGRCRSHRHARTSQWTANRW